MLPFEPWDGRALTGANGVPTVGGMVATNASGPRRIAAGACRDLMLGVRFVDGTGAVVKNGGRVMKNVTGLDLVKLMAGSHGTLGVLTEVGVQGAAAAGDDGDAGDRRARRETAGRAMRAAMATPCDVTGAAHAGRRTLLRLEGFEASVAHRAKVLAAALARVRRGRRSRRCDWAAIRDAAAFAGREGAVWRVSVRPSDGPAVGARLAGAEVIYDWAGGLLWVLAPEALDVRGGARRDRRATRRWCGRATAAKARWGVFHPEPAPVAALAAGLRARFDPAGHPEPRADGRARGRGGLMQTNFTPEQLADPGDGAVEPDPADLRALRLLHRDLPDLPGARRRARQPARAHLPDQGHAGGRAAGRRRRPSSTSTAASPASPA